MENVLVTGGTGLVGKHLCKRLKEKGYNVAILSRRNNKGNYQYYSWDLKRGEIEKKAIETADCIIHLAGASLTEKRWTESRKQQIVDSRVKSGELIFAKIKEQKKVPKVFISASGIGYYGQKTTEKIFEENDLPANDFLAETCKKWEQMANKFTDIGVRTVKIRTGIVLTKQGGALSKMMTAVKLGLGSAIGSGRQYFPWIHIDDLCGIYIKAIEDTKMEGAYNAVAPEHKTNKEFTHSLAQILKKPFWFPNIPAIMMKILFGRMSEILLNGSRVSAEKIRSAGYIFLYPKLENALVEITQKSKNNTSNKKEVV
jgi:uncharacterized protein (TIGR01777 family)